MRIAFITTEYITEPNFAGGLANYTHRIVQSLKSLGHTAEVFVLSRTNECIEHDGVRVYRVKVHGPLWLRAIKKLITVVTGKAIGGPVSILERVFSLQTRLDQRHQEAPFDLVQYTHLLGTGAMRGAMPTVVRLSSYPDLWIPYGFQFSSPFERWMEDRALKRADAVFAPSEWVANYVQTKLDLPVETVESPFVPPLLDEMDTNVLSRIWGDSPMPSQYGLYLGSYAEWKGVFVLADALSELLARHHDLGFVFAGRDLSVKEGQPASEFIRRKLEKYSDRIRVLPVQKHAQLFPLIAQADFVALPSLADNLPNSCLESMWMQKLVIGTRGRSFEQLIDNGVSGLLCEPGDVSSLVVCVDRALSMSTLELGAIGRKAKERIDSLSPEMAGKQHLAFYRETLKKFDDR